MNLIISSLLVFIALTVHAFSKPKDFRFFSQSQKNISFENHKGICFICKIKVAPYKGLQRSAEFDHWKPFSKNGKTIQSNCILLCKNCNRIKGSFYSTNSKDIIDFVLSKKH